MVTSHGLRMEKIPGHQAQCAHKPALAMKAGQEIASHRTMRHQSDGRERKGIETRMDSIYTPQRVRKKAAVYERLRHVLAMMVWLDLRATLPWRAHRGGTSDASHARRGIGCN